MSEYRMGKLVVVILVTSLLVAWLRNVQVVASPNDRQAVFSTHVNSDLHTEQQPSPQIQLEVPAAALVGEWVTIRLIATNVYDLGGFQVEIRFDSSKLSLAQAEATPEFARGRGLVPMDYVIQNSSVLLGAATCPAADCTTSQYQQNTAPLVGPAEMVELASFVFQVRRGGLIELELADIVLVDTTGNPLLASNQFHATLRIQPALPTLDLSGNKTINDADAYLAISAWRELQRNGRCLAETITHYDVDGSGCITIADIQTILAAWGETLVPELISPADDSAVNATFTVNSAANGGDTNPGNGQCRTVLGTCTLQAAIAEANARPGPDTIHFNIRNLNGSCPNLVVIEPDTPLIVDAADNSSTTINGYTQCNASANTHAMNGNAVIKIEIRGANEEFVFGLHVLSPGNTIRGLALYDWHRQIQILGGRAHHNVIEGNFIGTNAANTHTQTASGIEGDGLRLEIGTHHNLIGGTNPSDRNIISGNDQDGLGLQGSGVANNTIINNYIGLKQSGQSKLRNGADGVDIAEGVADNWLGGLNPGERNVISGNNRDGVEISHSSDTRNNHVLGNFIGLNAAGTTPIGNGERGVTFEDLVNENHVYRNVIVGNGGDGVRFYTVFSNRLYDNFIGVAPTGIGANDVIPVPGTQNGLATIPNGTGGGAAGTSGVLMTGGSQGNAVIRNIIAYHPGNGILLNVDPGYLSYGTCETYYNEFSKNNLYENSGKGVRLKSDPCEGSTIYYPNEGIAVPILSQATTALIIGTTCAGCSVEIFIADKTVVNHPDGDNWGEGKQYLVSGTANDFGSFIIPLPNVNPGTIVTAHTTDEVGNTSEFARNVAVVRQGTTVYLPTMPNP